MKRRLPIKHTPLLTILFFLSTILATAQTSPDDIDWKKPFGGKRFDEAFDIIENKEGQFVIVGQSKHFDSADDKVKDKENKIDEGGNNDLLFLIIDKEGNILRIKTLGHKQSEAAHSVVQTYDGGYAVAGYTNSKMKGAFGKKDAWIIKLDEKGSFLWEKRYGGGDNDAFLDILQDNEGNLIVTGYKSKGLLVVKLDRHGNPLWEQTPLNDKTSFRGNAALVLDNGEILVVGRHGNNRKSKAFFVGLDKNGNIKNKAQFFGDLSEEAYDIVQTERNKFALLSRSYKRSGGDGVLLIFVNKKGEEQKSHRFTEKNNDLPKAFIKDYENVLWITGGSKSHSSSGTKDKFFVFGTDLEGKEIQDDWTFIGGNLKDYANQIIQSSDGSIYLVGHTYSENLFAHDSDCYIVKFKSKGFPSNTAATNIEATEVSFFDKDEDQGLSPEERGFVRFKLTNNGSNDAYQIKATVNSLSGKTPFLQYPESLVLGHLPAGESKYFSVPLKGLEGMASEQVDFNIAFTEANNATIPSITFSVNLKKDPTVLLAIKDHQFIGAEQIERGKPIKLKVTLVNNGDKAAANLRGVFSFERNVMPLTEKTISPNNLAPGESYTFEIDFEIDNIYQGDFTSIGFRYYAADGFEAGVPNRFKLGTENITERELPILSISSSNLSDKYPNIKRGMPLEMTVKVTNTGKVAAAGISGLFFAEKGIKYLSPAEQNDISIASGESKTFTHSFQIEENFEEQLATLGFKIQVDPTKEIKFPKGNTVYTPIQLPALRQPVDLVVNEFSFSSPAPISDRSKEITLNINLENKGGQADNLITLFRTSEGITSASPGEEELATIEALKKWTATHRFKISDSYDGDQVTIDFEIRNKDYNDLLASQTIPLAIAPLVPAVVSPPILSMRGSRILNGPIEKGKEMELEITLENIGEATATGIIGRFGLERNILALGEKKFKIASLAKGEQQKLSLKFKVEDVYIGNGIQISFNYQANEAPYISPKKVSMSYSISAKAGKEPIAYIDWARPTKRVFKGMEKTTIPVEIALDIFSNQTLEENMFEVYVDGMVEKHSKAGEESLRKLKTSRKDFTRFRFATKINLREGTHDVYVKLKTKQIEEQSETITLSYKANTINLHFIGVGIGEYDNISSLAYTPKDVRDVANVFKSQEGKLFEKVYTDLICDNCENNKTDQRSIIRNFNKLIIEADERFQENDLIVIYISSHGKTMNNKFKVLPSDYENDYTDKSGDLFTVDFEKHILKNIRQLDATHKFIFVDACHSGAIEGEDNFETLQGAKMDDELIQSIILKKLIEGEKLTRPMMSCQGGESSWEHPNWENGAFTEALLEAFANTPVDVGEGKKMKATEDEILTFQELYRFLQKRVPYIVNTKYETSQTPYIPEALVEDAEDLPFFKIESFKE